MRLSGYEERALLKVAADRGMSRDAQVVPATWREAFHGFRTQSDVEAQTTTVAVKDGTGRRIVARVESPTEFQFHLNGLSSATSALSFIPYIGPGTQLLLGPMYLLLGLFSSKLPLLDIDDGRRNSAMRSGAKIALMGAYGLVADIALGPVLGALLKATPGAYLAVQDGKQAIAGMNNSMTCYDPEVTVLSDSAQPAI